MMGRRYVLLDEPFQGLAPALAQRYAEALSQLRREDTELGILITESNPDLLKAMCERTYVLERGAIVSQSGAMAGSDLT
jgi:branched-chain amino acid transport system ATP-binding protein